MQSEASGTSQEAVPSLHNGAALERPGAPLAPHDRARSFKFFLVGVVRNCSAQQTPRERFRLGIMAVAHEDSRSTRATKARRLSLRSHTPSPRDCDRQLEGKEVPARLRPLPRLSLPHNHHLQGPLLADDRVGSDSARAIIPWAGVNFLRPVASASTVAFRACVAFSHA